MTAPLYVMPRTPHSWGGAAALWVTVAGWAEADRRRGQTPHILTPKGVLSVEQALNSTSVSSSSDPGRVRPGPKWARQLARDAQRSVAMARYRRAAADLLRREGCSVSGFVWQHHELFHRTGHVVAEDHDLPLIEYVHAPIVWEARRWEVNRPISGGVLERIAERPQFRRADLVACVSEEVRYELLRLGVDSSKLVVAPMGVDQYRFTPDVDGGEWAERLSDLGDFVMGWAGSVRKFHHIELALHAVKRLRVEGFDVGLAIAGEGQDRPRLQEMTQELQVEEWVRFVGQIPNPEMPRFLGGIDAAVITAGADQEFHYSPLKLREYQAMALPVIVPRLGEMARMIEHGVNGLLYEPGDEVGLAAAVRRLADDRMVSAVLGQRGRSGVLESGTWDAISNACLERISLHR